MIFIFDYDYVIMIVIFLIMEIIFVKQIIIGVNLFLNNMI
jgi:hypothetical protein